MNYQKEAVVIEGTKMADIADALMVLSDFPRESALVTVNNVYRAGNSKKCAASFHKESLDRVDGDVLEALKCIGPSIVVGQVYRVPEGKSDFKPTNEYEIEFDTETVDPRLIEEIKEYLYRN